MHRISHKTVRTVIYEIRIGTTVSVRFRPNAWNTQINQTIVQATGWFHKQPIVDAAVSKPKTRIPIAVLMCQSIADVRV